MRWARVVVVVVVVVEEEEVEVRRPGGGQVGKRPRVAVCRPAPWRPGEGT